MRTKRVVRVWMDVLLIVGLVELSIEGAAWGESYRIMSIVPPVTAPEIRDGSRATGINNAGQVVGASYICFSKPGVINCSFPHGYIFDGGDFTLIDFPGTIRGTTLEGINDVGQVLGNYLSPFIIKSGVFTTLNIPHAYATDLNNDGYVVGSYQGTDLHHHGFLWKDGAYATLDIPGAQDTFLQGVNDAGQIVGFSHDVVPVPEGLRDTFRGFLFSGGIWTTIEFPSTNGVTQLRGINNLGDVIGRVDSTPFLLHQDGSFSNIPFLDIAYDINDAGQIVGEKNGGLAFLLTPCPNCSVTSIPEPASLLLLTTGLLGLLGYGWRQRAA